ncbi:MAG TPA: hypothetical protein VF011_04305 [Terriglobales bacterium]
MKFFLVFLLAAATSVADQDKLSTSSETLILTNANVVDTRRGLTLPNLTVVIKGGMIKAVAKAGLIDAGHQRNRKVRDPRIMGHARAHRWQMFQLLAQAES